jgi:transposase InsO family protein
MLIVHRLHQGQSVAEVAATLGVTSRTVRKWRDRFDAQGEAGLRDRSSRPHRSPCRLSTDQQRAIEALRRQRLPGPAIARRLGLSRIGALDPRPPVIRYERDRPGEPIHIDIKVERRRRLTGRVDGIGHRITSDRHGQSSKRRTGWEYVHVAVDDTSWLAYTELLPSERKDSAIAFTGRALAWFKSHGIAVERVMTDNGSAYKSVAYRDLLAEHDVRHKRTKPYTPRTKAERFIQTSLRKWAYARPFLNSADRAVAMNPWLCDYNRSRPHAALGGNPPISRIPGDNVPGNDI